MLMTGGDGAGEKQEDDSSGRWGGLALAQVKVLTDLAKPAGTHTFSWSVTWGDNSEQSASQHSTQHSDPRGSCAHAHCFPSRDQHSSVVLAPRSQRQPGAHVHGRLGLLLVGWGRTHPTVGVQELESVSLRVY